MQTVRRSLPYRLAIDLGSTSLGWCILELDRNGKPCGIRRMGVRIFSDGRNPQDKTSLAVARRVARQMRRRRDRMLRRRERLMSALIRHGLMPAGRTERKTLERLDPYALRRRGLAERLEPHELGRALFHLNQRRGFQVVRKTHGGDEEAGKIRQGIGRLEQELADRRMTLGAFLAWLKDGRKSVRMRMEGSGAKAEYPLYPARSMLQDEFTALWAAQARHHPTLLTEEVRRDLEHRIFHQRPLKAVPVGKCSLFPEDARAPRALPSAQLFRLYQELANLRIVTRDRAERPLTVAERDTLVALVRRKSAKALTFQQVRRALKLESDVSFSHETERRSELPGDETAALMSDRKRERFGARWATLTLAEQDDVVERLLTETNEAALLDWLTARWGLTPDAAARTADAPLPDFHLRIGRKALRALLPIMQQESVEEDGRRRPMRYDEAVARLGLHHSDRRSGSLLDALPYYGRLLERHVAFGTGAPGDEEEKRLGRFANPTVHIGLNQLRQLVNALVARYGRPVDIVVELGRDLKLSLEERRRKNREYAENQRKNDARKALLASVNVPVNARNMMKLRLWEEQGKGVDKCCPYTGQAIGLHLLLSEQVDIDHILPFSKSLDDSAANKVVCMTEANRQKRNRTPFDAFGGDERRWSDILGRVDSLPANKRWRFAPDALARYEAEGGFEGRQLNDTRYLARVAREYLTHICTDVRVSPGRLTALLRRRWGLDTILGDHNRKNRNDHRHHAIDAAAIGCIDRSLIQRVQTIRAREEESGLERLLEDMPEPWEGFREAVEARVRFLIVSHRPEHGTGGRMHEDTAYGFVADPAREDGCNLVFRKPLTSLSEREVGRIRARDLRAVVRDRLKAHRAEGLDHAKAMVRTAEEVAALATWKGIRHVRLLTKEASPIPIAGEDGRPYKGLIAGEIHHVDIVALPDGRWSGRPATLFEARRTALSDGRAAPPQPAPGERFVMRLHKGDFVKLDHDGEERVMRVVWLEPGNSRFRFAEHNEAGELDKRHADPDDPFRWLIVAYDKLRRRRARRVTVDRLGKVRDPGFPKWAAQPLTTEPVS
ncbi:type II CRISPR RNA-guided endonuclease Cas9 [Azospirillum sp. A39]|uniref:type II CRISPR RNA-guided endonuclease Cas9 n=1 Tax=Azospirillum sp. A39 TaxID=3462279 RepID=UPI0040468835